MKKKLLIIAFLTMLCSAVFAACGKEPVKYSLAVDGSDGGQIVIYQIEAAAGETVIVHFEPNEGYVFKEGSMQVNGVYMEGTSFIMPAENVTVSGEFVLADYKGTYIYYTYDSGRGGGYFFEFINVKESTLSVGVTLATYEANFDYVIYENVPYEENDYVITATVNGEAWSAEIGPGTLFHDCEYTLCEDIPLSGTYTEIQEQNGIQDSYIKKDYTFTDGALVGTTYFEDGTTSTENATYKQFGSFLFIEEPNTDSETHRIKYGVLTAEQGYIKFLYNYHYVDVSSATANVLYNTVYWYPDTEDIALKEGGAYILQEEVNPFNGESWGEPDCFDFIALQGGKLALSRHGVYYDGGLHYFGADTAYQKIGNALKVSYRLRDDYGNNKQFSLVFHIVDENTVLIMSTANQMQKFVFVQNCAFEGGYGKSYSNSESTTYEVSFYENGEYGNKYFDKQTNSLAERRVYGTYQVYGDILVVKMNGGGVYIGGISEGNETDGCDYLFSYRTVEWNAICGSEQSEPLWKSVGGGK